MTGVYRERRAVLVEHLVRDFGDHLELMPSEAGLHVAVLARSATADQLQNIRRRAAGRSVAIQPIGPFAVASRARSGLMSGYGAISTTRIKEGLDLLRSCFESEQ